ncbi:tumor necrosis factor receptor superfamily member 14 isoform X2 [Manis javanica]|uniref:tumor necrosis factor receptor superfamily member 14 isoform X2 n=1 Tax=Manis javanica TaxID=9974 RepID=UPI003C6D08D8
MRGAEEGHAASERRGLPHGSLGPVPGRLPPPPEAPLLHPGLTPCKEEEYPVGAECCPKCSPGYRVKQDCGELTGTLCVPCTTMTYTAHFSGLSECLPCRECDPDMGLVIRRKCSPTENTVCGCDRGHFCIIREEGNCVECQPHTDCRPGQRVRERGTEWQDRVCEDCLPGTFSPNGTLEECLPWTRCKGLFETEANPGTNNTDVTCYSWGQAFLGLTFVLVVLGGGVTLICVWLRRRKRGEGRCLGPPGLRSPAGLLAKRTVSPQEAGARAAAGQALPAVPDVTTVAVEETASVLTKMDQPIRWLKEADHGGPTPGRESDSSQYPEVTALMRGPSPPLTPELPTCRPSHGRTQ